jgi:hypothetical protein
MKRIFIVAGHSLFFIGRLFVGQPVFSQNMNNPYSVYGIGDIDNKTYNRTSGMAGTGLALKSSYYFIDNNPAAIAGLSHSFFTVHLAMTGKASTFSGEPIDLTNSKSSDMWIKRLALAIKINRYWASSIGFGQFSNVGYKFSGSRFVEGTNSSYRSSYQGDGGLNDYYWTNAFSIGKHWSLGIKSSLIAGSINQVETIADDGLQTIIVDSLQDYMANLRFQAGFIYERALNKKWDISLGGKYSPRARFASNRTLSIRSNDVSIITNKYLLSNRFYLPETYAAGISLKRNKVMTYAIDYTYENESAVNNTSGNGWNLVSNNRVSAGVEFVKTKVQSNQLIEKRFFQLGGYYNSGYLQVRNTPIREYGFTAGMGGALSHSLLYGLSLEAGVKGTKAAGLIRETYLGFTLNITYRDFLYSKGRRYD